MPKNITRKKISIGVALCMLATGVGKCGGAVVTKTKTPEAASSVSTSQKKTKMMTMRIVKQLRNEVINICAASAVEN